MLTYEDVPTLNLDLESPEIVEYLRKPYRRIVHSAGDIDNPSYIAEVFELDGCFAEGKNEADALKNLTDAMKIHIAFLLHKKIKVPDPIPSTDYSGKILVRIPPTLHYRLVMRSKIEGVSLNQLLVSIISHGFSKLRSNEPTDNVYG
jgi:predicted HicB family RNase H-like nuclease